VSDVFGVEVELAGGAESVLVGGVELGFAGGAELGFAGGVELCPLAASVDPDARISKLAKTTPAGAGFPRKEYFIQPPQQWAFVWLFRHTMPCLVCGFDEIYDAINNIGCDRKAATGMRRSLSF
jgi:hypothetical protein